MDGKKFIPEPIGQQLATDMFLRGAPEWAQGALAAAKEAASAAGKDGFIDFSFTFTCKARRHADAIEWWLKSHDIEVIIISPRQIVDQKGREDMHFICSARLPVFRKEWCDGE